MGVWSLGRLASPGGLGRVRIRRQKRSAQLSEGMRRGLSESLQAGEPGLPRSQTGVGRGSHEGLQAGWTVTGLLSGLVSSPPHAPQDLTDPPSPSCRAELLQSCGCTLKAAGGGDDTSKPGTHCVCVGGHLWCFSFQGTLGSARTAALASRYCEAPSR